MLRSSLFVPESSRELRATHLRATRKIAALGFLVELLASLRRRPASALAFRDSRALLAQCSPCFGWQLRDRSLLLRASARLLHVALRGLNLLRGGHGVAPTGCRTPRMNHLIAPRCSGIRRPACECEGGRGCARAVLGYRHRTTPHDTHTRDRSQSHARHEI